MRTTLSCTKADVGSIGGHIKPSAKLKETIERFTREKGKKLLTDLYVSSTGDDTALLMAHERGVDDPKIHELAWDAFMAGTKVAKEQGLYGAGQDLLKDAFSGNIRGLGRAVAVAQDGEGLHLLHHGRQPHRGRPGYRA